MKLRILVSLLLLISVASRAQKINVSLPQMANKEYAFVLYEGIKKDTIQKGNFSFLGTVTVNIPIKYKEYTGIGSMFVKDAQSINVIVHNENVNISSGKEQQYTVKDSPENEFLVSFLQGNIPEQKDTTMYAPHFINLLNYMMELSKAVQQSAPNVTEKGNLISFAVDHLDIDRLYTSGLWYNVVSGLVQLYGGQPGFAKDMIHILKRIKSDTVFEHFATNLVTITEQYGWDNDFDSIIAYVKESGRIETPKGVLYTAFALSKITRGSKVPPIEGLEKPLDGYNDRKVLLVFYQPGCENCKLEIEYLLKEYPKLEKMNLRIISISGDYNKETFAEDVNRFPWKDKICDFKGFAGKNFLSYGIMGTPTLFLVDENHELLRRYAHVADVISYLEQNN